MINKFSIALLILAISVSCKSKKENKLKIADQETIVNTDVVSTGLTLGNKAPELIGLSFKDSTIKLSSLNGKYVLIDFWASWCVPCRYENPNVVKSYHKFQNKKFKNGNGFTVLGVSLDEKKNSWEAAVKKDGLIWPYHISDLKGWNSDFARIYNITSIPYNFLINGNGIIIAVNLRGEDLEKTLEKHIEQ